MQLVIHRGAHQVGGSCVELKHMDSTILLDIGLPLDSNFGSDPESNLPQPLFNEIRDGIKKINGVLLSHAHMDHICGFDAPGSAALLLTPDLLGRKCENLCRGNVFERCASVLLEGEKGLWQTWRASGNTVRDCAKGLP